MRYGDRVRSEDIVLAAANADPVGMVQNGTHILVLDRKDTLLYAYKKSDLGYEVGENIDLPHANNDHPIACAAFMQGATPVLKYTVYDSVDRQSYGILDSSEASNTAANIAQAQFTNYGDAYIGDMAASGAVVYALDFVNNRILAFAVGNTSVLRDTDKDFFSLHKDNCLPRGLWADATHLFVTDATGWLFPYKLSDKKLDRHLIMPIKAFSDNPREAGSITGTDGYFRIAGIEAGRLVAYARTNS